MFIKAKNTFTKTHTHKPVKHQKEAKTEIIAAINSIDRKLFELYEIFNPPIKLSIRKYLWKQ